MQDGFSGKLTDRPEPLPRADHGRWTSHAAEYFTDTDHLVQVAGITVGQIKKLKQAGIATAAYLAAASGKADVYFDMESYPLVLGGLEYLFGACLQNRPSGPLEFKDGWAHDRDEEKLALEGFVDWVFDRWKYTLKPDRIAATLMDWQR